MRIIEFKKDQKNIWNEFIVENDSECFLQSWEWGEFQCSLGRKIWKIGAIEDDMPHGEETGELKSRVPNPKTQTSSKSQNPNSKTGIMAVALLIRHDLPFGMSYLYCPRGPIVSKSKTENEKLKILEYLFNKIKKIALQEKSLFLRIDPAIEMNREYFKSFRKASSEIQPKDTLILDLAKTQEKLLAGMKQKTRYNIRLAEKRGVEVFVASDYEKYFSDFWNLIEETSERNKIVSYDEKYYRKMLEVLRENNFAKNGSGVVSELRAKLYLARYEGRIIAANIVLFFGDIAVYLHGASSGKYRNVMAPYLLQWEQILNAKNRGYKKYDFWGITINDEKEKWRGLTRFKKGFGGQEESYIGAHDFPFDVWKYDLYVKAKNILGFLRKAK